MKSIERFRGRNIFVFFLGGMLAPYFYWVLFFISFFLIFYFLFQVFPSLLFSSTPGVFVFINCLLVILLKIFFLYFLIRISKSQFRKYRNQGGKLSKNKVIILALIWWTINIYNMFLLFYGILFIYVYLVIVLSSKFIEKL